MAVGSLGPQVSSGPRSTRWNRVVFPACWQTCPTQPQGMGETLLTHFSIALESLLWFCGVGVQNYSCNSESVLNSHTTHLYSAGWAGLWQLLTSSNSQVPLSIPYMSKTLLRVLHHFYEGGCRWAHGTWRLTNVSIMIFVMYSIELGTWCAFSKDLWSRYLNLHVEILP